MKKDFCKKCNSAVEYDKVTKGYYCYCPTCDEDLYKIETYTNKRNWIKEAKEYADFLNLEEPTIKTTKQAKDYLYELLDFMLSTNGEGEMYKWELDLAKELNINLENN